MTDLIRPLHALRDTTYHGFSPERAKVRMLEVCRIAGVTGQTMVALQHLTALAPIALAEQHEMTQGLRERVTRADPHAL